MYVISWFQGSLSKCNVCRYSMAWVEGNLPPILRLPFADGGSGDAFASVGGCTAVESSYNP
jgi:hypothetical protein